MKLSLSALLLGVFASSFSLFGEVRVLTLRQALDMAMAQNPDVLLARLDAQKAREQVTVTRDPFRPKVFAGRGAAWSTGFPSSIEGSAPSIVQVKTQMAIFNRPQSYLTAQANEEVRGAGAMWRGARKKRCIESRRSIWTPNRRAAAWRPLAGRSTI